MNYKNNHKSNHTIKYDKKQIIICTNNGVHVNEKIGNSKEYSLPFIWKNPKEVNVNLK